MTIFILVLIIIISALIYDPDFTTKLNLIFKEKINQYKSNKKNKG